MGFMMQFCFPWACFPVRCANYSMKNLSTLSALLSSGPLTRIFMAIALIALISCKSTTTTRPSRSASLDTLADESLAKQKRTRKFPKKKPGDALADFEKDRRKGKLVLKQYGAPGSLTPYYNRLLTTELGIKIEVISNGMLPPDMLRYAKQYNALMTGEIQKKYGPDILREARRRALIIKAQVDSGSIEAPR